MFQASQIGKYRKKEEVLNAKKGHTFITPKNREYQLDWEKIGNKFIIVVIYQGIRCQVKESIYNKTNTDDIIDTIIRDLQKCFD